MSQDNIEQLLGQEPATARRLSFWLKGMVLLVVGVAAATWMIGNGDGQPGYVTAEARRGSLTVTVTATGELKPLNQVEVGTEVSGTIETVLVDYNDRVRRGQVLAKLDTAQLEARRRQTEAALTLAKAKVEEAEATLTEAHNKLERARRLAKKALISKEESDVAEASYLRAKAALAIAKAQVAETQAQLDENVRVLEKAVIRAPIDGIVLTRQVEPGQTVAASLQTPVLFTLAENLAQMELHVAVDEADVGQVHEGQPAVFTVDAYPDRRFQAVVTQVRYAPKTVEGVVTYETLLAVNNADLSLRPGMTATVEIITGQIDDALLVPNGALRFSPPPAAPEPKSGGSVFSRLFPQRPVRQSTETNDASKSHTQRVWVLQRGQPVPVPVTIGASDGMMTEVKSGEIRPGMALVVDIETQPS